jgi:hypothetical protein
MSSKRHPVLGKHKSTKKATGAVRRRPAPAKEWNSYLTDADRYKITKEEELRKKQLLLSRHNILSESSRPITTYPTSRATTSTAATISTPGRAVNDGELHGEATALDLLGSDDENVEATTPNLDRKRKHASSSAKKPLKKSDVRQGLADNKGMGTTAKRLAFGRHHTTENRLKRQQDGPSEPVDVAFKCTGSVTSRIVCGVFRRHSPQKHRPTDGPATAASPIKRSGTGFPSSPSVEAPNKSGGAEKDYDLVYVADEVRSLFSELKYYEELSGRRSILDTREVRLPAGSVLQW